MLLVLSRRRAYRSTHRNTLTPRALRVALGCAPFLDLALWWCKAATIMSITTTSTEAVAEAAAVTPRITLNASKPTALEKHRDYYMPNGNVVIQVCCGGIMKGCYVNRRVVAGREYSFQVGLVGVARQVTCFPHHSASSICWPDALHRF